MSDGSTELWAHERLTAHSALQIKLGREWVRVQSAYQCITVHETEDFGRLLRLDGCNMTSERDEFCYHEPMVHPALLAQARPRAVLIVGGGDGGAAKEALKHRCVTRVVIAELDKEVVNVSKQWLANVHQGAFADPRVTLAIGDGFEYLRRNTGRFDLIVMDLTDPSEHAVGLYSEDFFKLARERLTDTGILTTHLGSNFFHRPRVERLLAALRPVFRHVCPMSAYVPIYGAQWSMACSSMHSNLAITGATKFASRATERGLPALRLYNPAQFPTLFALSGCSGV
jgi:spermidine synthase